MIHYLHDYTNEINNVNWLFSKIYPDSYFLAVRPGAPRVQQPHDEAMYLLVGNHVNHTKTVLKSELFPWESRDNPKLF